MAIVKPRAKEANSHSEDFSNYRPISNPLHFKTIERAAFMQMREHFKKINLFSQYQIAYRKFFHEFLLSILETSLVCKDKVLSFLNSYLIGRSQKVLIDGEYSMARTIKTGVPQGSVLGPVLFSCYLVPLEVLFERLDVNYHFYADDTYLFYLPCFDKSGVFWFDTLQKCFSSAKLRLSSNKTEFLFISRKNS